MRKLFLLCLFVVSGILIIPASAQSMPSFADLPAGEWTQIPVSDGVCLYGDDYSFFVRPNEQQSEKLLVYFQGGGACWDGMTCGSVGEFASFYDVTEATIASYNRGIFEFDNPDNPLADYDVVFVPYCTGDIHAGNAELTLEVPTEINPDVPELDVYFKGHHNAQLVLNWVYENILEPEHIVVSGCSAGGYGATVQAPYIMAHYADVPAVMLADSSHGVLPDQWSGLITWGILQSLPDFLSELREVTIENYDTTLLISLSAEYFPQNRFAQFNSYIDAVQVGFFGTLLGYDLNFENEIVSVAAQWSAALTRNLRQLGRYDNVRNYTAGGIQHCVVTLDLFYEYDQADVVFSQWVADLIEGTADNVTCSVLAQTCFTSPVEDEN